MELNIGDIVQVAGKASSTYTIIQIDHSSNEAMVILNASIPIRPTYTVNISDLTMFGSENKYVPTDKEKESVIDYSGSGYDSWNHFLRNGQKVGNSDKKKINELTEYLYNADKYSGMTYRGMGFNDSNSFDDFTKGIKSKHIFQDNGFMSTTKSAKAANGFSYESDYRVLLNIKSKTGVDISALTNSPQEAEVLFNRGSQFEVESYGLKTDGGVSFLNVILKEL